MKRYKTGVDRDGHRGEVKVIEKHWQMVVKALRRCKVQLQRPEKERPSNPLSITRGPDSETVIDQFNRRGYAQFVDKCPTDMSDSCRRDVRGIKSSFRRLREGRKLCRPRQYSFLSNETLLDLRQFHQVFPGTIGFRT